MKIPKPRREVNRKLLDAIKRLPCCVCGSMEIVDPSHIKSKGAGGPDTLWNVVPHCRVHHDEWGRGVLTFVKKYPRMKWVLEQRGWEVTRNGLFHPKTRSQEAHGGPGD